MAAHRFGGIGGALAVVVLALGACAGEGGDDLTAEEQMEAALDEAADEMVEDPGATGTTVAAARETRPEPVDLDLPRETSYAHATWTVTEVAFQEAGVDEYGYETPPRAIVGFTVANVGEGGTDLTVSPWLLSLLDGDGTRLPAPFDALEEEVVVVGGDAGFEATFELDEGTAAEDLEGYTVQIGEEGYVPAPIPLSGLVPAPGYPVTLTMPAEVGGVMNGGPAAIRNLSGVVTLDFAGHRAEEGTRFLAVQGDMQGGDGAHFYPSWNDIRVSVDGIQADEAPDSPTLPNSFSNGGTATGTWVFVIPEDGKDGLVHFGSQSAPDVPGGPFTLPALP
jgi:hypothetical protein